MKGLSDFGLLGSATRLLRERLLRVDLAPAQGFDAPGPLMLHPTTGDRVAVRRVAPEAFDLPWASDDDVAWTLTCDGRRVRIAPVEAWFRCAVLDLEVAPELLTPLFGPGAFGGRTDEPSLWPRLARRQRGLRAGLIQAGRRALAGGATPREVVEALAAERSDRLHVDALGQVYEALLGQVRRRRGSYFTPPALARALVEVGVGPLVEAAGDVEAIERLRILDPAAGGGQVVLAALERLTRAWVVRAPGTEPLDLTAIRRRIATRCLAAADRDPDALAVARLSVATACGDPALSLPDLVVGDALLEVHDDELDQVEADDEAARTAWQAAVDAGGDGRAEAAALLAARARATQDHDALARSRHGVDVQVVHWRRLFPRGFDAVVGNPPYHRETSGSALFTAVRAARLGRHARSKGDLWFFFTHLALELLRPGGRHAFVVPGYWLKATGAGPKHLRAALSGLRWSALVDLDRLPVFSTPGGGTVAGRHVVFAVAKAAQADQAVAVYRVAPGPVGPRLAGLQRALASGASAGGVVRREVAASTLTDGEGKLLLALGLNKREHTLLGRLRNGALSPGWTVSEGITANPERVTARALARVEAELGVDLRQRGVEAGDPVFLLPADWPGLKTLGPTERERLLPFLKHEAVARLRAGPSVADPLLIYTTRDTAVDVDAIPTLAAHLSRTREIMELRRETRRGGRAWFQLHWPRAAELLVGPRVLVPRMTTWPAAALAEARCAVGESVYTILPPERRYSPLVAGLLNALPFALGILLTTKPRGKGVDIPRAALAGCPWPSAEELDDPPPALQEALRASEALRGLASARAFEGPWWEHPEPAVADAGRALDEAVCRWLDVPYAAVRDLAEARPC